MRAKTTKAKTDSRGKEHPPGTEISVMFMPRGPHQVVVGKVWGGGYVAVDQWSCERAASRARR